jgi:acyl-homoserine lactone acylase PvdQ
LEVADSLAIFKLLELHLSEGHKGIFQQLHLKWYNFTSE